LDLPINQKQLSAVKPLFNQKEAKLQQQMQQQLTQDNLNLLLIKHLDQAQQVEQELQQ
jgi:hypothetical protein